MLKPPSQIKTYSVIFSGDPALVLPADPKDQLRALELARETGQWASLIKEGEVATVFELRPLPGTAFDWWAGEVRRKRLSNPETNTLLVRLALRKVEHFGAHKVELETCDGQQLATEAIIDALYAESGDLGRAVVGELGDLIYKRAERTLGPKS